MIDLSGVNELMINITANCPACGHAMYYTAFFAGEDIKRVHCLISECGEYHKLWDLDMRTGMARRVVSAR